MSNVTAIPLPVAHVGSVNAWLVRGEPLTLVDTGPRDDAALAALEAGLRREGLRVEDLELVLVTHHHLDHVGLAATIKRRSGAVLAALDRVADYTERYGAEVEHDRRFARALMAHHAVPDEVIAENEGFWTYVRSRTEDVRANVRLADGDRIAAGGRTLRAVWRPGHSTTDTLLVDDAAGLAFTGDHLLATISSNTEIHATDRADDERARSRRRYLEGLRRTGCMPHMTLLTGHGAAVARPDRLVRARLQEHARRCERILAILGRGPSTAYGIARHLWSAHTVAEQPLLVVWEVVGHLELLLAAGRVRERAGAGGSTFGLAAHGARAA